MHHPSHLPLVGRGVSVVALLIAVTGCPGGSVGGTDTDGFGTDPGTSTSDSSTLSSSSSTSTVTTSSSTSTSTSTSTASTTTSSSDPTVDPDTGDTDPTGGGACLRSGEYILVLTGRTDLYGHFPFLKLWFLPPEESTDEIMQIDVGADGTLTFTILPRAAGSGDGHEGLAGLTGTITETCDVDIATQTDFTSDTGPFNGIDVTLTGILTPYDPNGPAPILALTLEGGDIPSGPITYDLEVGGPN